MNVSCPKCSQAIRVDAAQLPATGKARVGCPGCQSPFEFDVPTSSQAAPTGQPDEAWLKQQLAALKEELKRELQGQVAAPAAAAGADWNEDSSRSAKHALVCASDQAFAASLVGTLKGLGWESEVVPDVEGAVRLLERHEYGVTLLDRTLGGDPQGGPKALQWINGRPGPERRRSFVVYLTDDARSMDTGSAFIIGANMTINKADVAKLGHMLQKGIDERDALYRVFNEVTDAVARGE